MKTQDRRLFGAELGVLAEVLLRGADLVDARVEAYWQDLIEYDIGEVVRAMRLLRRTRSYGDFPSPGEIITEIKTWRRAKSGEARALKPAPPSPEEQAQVKAAMRDLIGKLERGEPLTPAESILAVGLRGSSERTSEPEAAEHERRRTAARRQIEAL